MRNDGKNKAIVTSSPYILKYLLHTSHAQNSRWKHEYQAWRRESTESFLEEEFEIGELGFFAKNWELLKVFEQRQDVIKMVP